MLLTYAKSGAWKKGVGQVVVKIDCAGRISWVVDGLQKP